MMLHRRRAERKKAKLRLGLSGPAGSGKTIASLLIAYGLCKDWGKITLVDTENGSGDLYVNHIIKQNGKEIKIGVYNVITLNAPYEPEKYIRAIEICEEAGDAVVILDSATHAWAGKGGLLEDHGKITDTSSSGNSWAAWRKVTPRHNAFVEKMLTCHLHLIATLRAKTEYVQDKNPDGNTIIKKVGLNPIQRDGMEFEFTAFFDLSQNHNASCSKDRSSLFDGKIWLPDIETGEIFLDWLDSGVDIDPEEEARKEKERYLSAKAEEAKIKEIRELAKQKGWDSKIAKEKLRQITKRTTTASLTNEEADKFIKYLNLKGDEKEGMV